MSKTKAFNVGNYYGNLEIKKEGDKYFWSVENYSGHEWEEIPAYLYEALEKFYKASKTRRK